MAIVILTSIRKTDGSVRRVFQAFYGEDQIEDVILEPGEKILHTAEASTFLARMQDGIEDPLPEDLKAEMLAINELCEKGDFVDITDKLD